MDERKSITLERGWAILLKDLGIVPQNVLRRAGLPIDLLNQDSGRISIPDYFRLVEALGVEGDAPDFPIRVATAASPEAFHPLMFAALCSPDFAMAVQRMAQYKRLVMPMDFDFNESDTSLEISWAWEDPTLEPPPLLVGMELVSKVHMARLGTREEIRPVRVCSPVPLDERTPFAEYFGVAPCVGRRASLTFTAEDARRPFMTCSDAMWEVFEPSLRRDLSKLEVLTPLSERVRTVLYESLPSGESDLSAVARRLGMSGRTLQRQLKEDGIIYRDVLDGTRRELAEHYLGHTGLSYGEIAFLVGFDETSSFFRAFRKWTGSTPESTRQRLARL